MPTDSFIESDAWTTDTSPLGMPTGNAETLDLSALSRLREHFDALALADTADTGPSRGEPDAWHLFGSHLDVLPSDISSLNAWYAGLDASETLNLGCECLLEPAGIPIGDAAPDDPRTIAFGKFLMLFCQRFDAQWHAQCEGSAVAARAEGTALFEYGLGPGQRACERAWLLQQTLRRFPPDDRITLHAFFSGAAGEHQRRVLDATLTEQAGAGSPSRREAVGRTIDAGPNAGLLDDAVETHLQCGAVLSELLDSAGSGAFTDCSGPFGIPACDGFVVHCGADEEFLAPPVQTDMTRAAAPDLIDPPRQAPAALRAALPLPRHEFTTGDHDLLAAMGVKSGPPATRSLFTRAWQQCGAFLRTWLHGLLRFSRWGSA